MRHFYTTEIGCDIGRDRGSCIDIIFFGHQVTMHQENERMRSNVIDHFGPVLGKEEWLEICKRCKTAGTEFLLPPTISAKGSEIESWKFVVKDPAGNTLEIKYYLNLAATLEKNSV